MRPRYRFNHRRRSSLHASARCFPLQFRCPYNYKIQRTFSLVGHSSTDWNHLPEAAKNASSSIFKHHSGSSCWSVHVWHKFLQMRRFEGLRERSMLESKQTSIELHPNLRVTQHILISGEATRAALRSKSIHSANNAGPSGGR